MKTVVIETFGLKKTFNFVVRVNSNQNSCKKMATSAWHKKLIIWTSVLTSDLCTLEKKITLRQITVTLLATDLIKNRAHWS